MEGIERHGNANSRYESAISTGQRRSPQNFIKFGSNNWRIEDYKEIGERLLTWAEMRCELVETFQNHIDPART